MRSRSFYLDDAARGPDITFPHRGEVGRGSGRLGLFSCSRIETLGEADCPLQA